LKANYKPTPASIQQAEGAEPTPAPNPKKGKDNAPSVVVATPAPSPNEKGDEQNGMTGEVPFVPTPAPQAQKAPEPLIPPTEDEAKMKARYREVKAAALNDKEIKALQDKADSASDQDQVAASKAYYKALFKKIRALDPTLSDHVDRMEKAMMRKLDGGGSGDGQ